MTRQEMKAAAKQQIKGNVGILFVIALLTSLITATVLGAILTPGLSLSLTMIYLGMTQGKKAAVGDMFEGVRHLGKAWWLNILMAFFVSLWSMLLVIPGLVKSYSYAMAPYILAENPELKAREALNESKRIMKGHKWDLFVLQLSFIGWELLGAITFGIAYIYVVPYMNAAVANFYNSVKAPVVEA